MDIEVPRIKLETASSIKRLSVTEDGKLMYRHTSTAIEVYSLPDMKMLEKFVKKINIWRDGDTFYEYESQMGTTYHIKDIIVVTSPTCITIIMNGRVKIFGEFFYHCVFHRDHMYYLSNDSDKCGLTLKRIQLHNINFDEIKVEVINVYVPYTVWCSISMKADDKYNRILICDSRSLTIFNLDNMNIEREIGHICDFTNEHTISFDQFKRTVSIYDLFSRTSKIDMVLPVFANSRSPQISGKYIIVTLERSKLICTLNGKIYAELYEEEGLPGYSDVVITVNDTAVVIYESCICVYDISRFNKKEQITTFFLGGISEDSSVSKSLMQNGLYDRNLLSLITELV